MSLFLPVGLQPSHYELQCLAQGYIPETCYAIYFQRFTPEEKSSKEVIKSKQVSLGLSINDQSFEVQKVADEGPCFGKVNVKDVLVKINGIPLKTKSREQVVNLTQGNEGTEATLTIRRDHRELDIRITRTFRSNWKIHIECGFRRRDYKEIERVFKEHCGAINGLGEGSLTKALKEFDPILDLSSKDLQRENALLKKFDTNSDGKVDFDEFEEAVQLLVPNVDWVHHLPLAEMLIDALPKNPGTNEVKERSQWTELDVKATVEAFSFGLGKLLCEDPSPVKYPEPTTMAEVTENALLCGGIQEFHEGLPPRIGYPHLQFWEACEAEHCEGGCATLEFVTTNNGIKTTPALEWSIAVGEQPCPEENMKPGRRIPKLDELMSCAETKEARLSREEVMEVVLYSGPMYFVYNSILRWLNNEVYRVCTQTGNYFSTSIHVLVSAVQKISIVSRVPPNTTLYRGLGHGTLLPVSFFQSDEFGRSGFTEYGFMSSTSKKRVAMRYAKAEEGNSAPAVLVFKVYSVDRGACIRKYSQYPDEVEYLHVPCSFVQKVGSAWTEKDPQGNTVTMFPVKVNVNLKAKTLEQILEEKKGLHVSAFQHLIREINWDLAEVAERHRAYVRMSSDKTSDATHTVEGFLLRIMQECQEVLNRHKAVTAKEYANELVFRRQVLEMMGMRSMARSKLLEWLENKTCSFIRFRWRCPLRTAHRQYISYLASLQPIHTLSAPSDMVAEVVGTAEVPVLRCEQEAAFQLLSLRGVVSGLVSEVNELGETRIMEMAAEGAPESVLELLVDAQAQVEGTRPDGVSSIILAAHFGHAHCVRKLKQLGASVNSAAHDGATPAIVAAQNGQLECLQLLKSLKADFSLKDKKGLGPLDMASMNCHQKCVKFLQEMGCQALSDSQDTLLGLHTGEDQVIPTDLDSVAGEGNRRLIISALDVSDVSGFMALDMYARSGVDVLLIVNYPAHLNVVEDDRDFEENHPGLGYRYGFERVLERDKNYGGKYCSMMDRADRTLHRSEVTGPTSSRPNNIMRQALTDLVFAIATRVWVEAAGVGSFFFCIGGVNTVNPFPLRLVRNEVRLYADLLGDPSLLAEIDPEPGVTYNIHGARVNFSMADYCDIYLDACGPLTHWNEEWSNRLGSVANRPKIRAAFLVGGTRADKWPVALPLSRELNRCSFASLHQLYNPHASADFLSFLNEFKIPTYMTTINEVSDLASDASGDLLGNAIPKFLDANCKRTPFLEGLAMAYYQSEPAPVRKPFACYGARALTDHLADFGGLMAERMQEHTLFFDTQRGVALVGKSGTWEEAREAFVGCVRDMQKCDKVTLVQAREDELLLLEHVGKLEVLHLRWVIKGDSKKLEVDQSELSEKTSRFVWRMMITVKQWKADRRLRQLGSMSPNSHKDNPQKWT